MLSTTDTFATTTRLPTTVSKPAVLKTLHNHTEMIELNPLVVKHERCNPHPAAPAEELDQQQYAWYEITDRLMSYLPFTVSYKSSFRNVSEGLKTHVYAPLGLDIKGSWNVSGGNDDDDDDGNGSGGISLRENVEMRCNSFAGPFVKKTLKDSHAVLVERLIEKAGHHGRTEEAGP